MVVRQMIKGALHAAGELVDDLDRTALAYEGFKLAPSITGARKKAADFFHRAIEPLMGG